MSSPSVSFCLHSRDHNICKWEGCRQLGCYAPRVLSCFFVRLSDSRDPLEVLRGVRIVIWNGQRRTMLAGLGIIPSPQRGTMLASPPLIGEPCWHPLPSKGNHIGRHWNHPLPAFVLMSQVLLVQPRTEDWQSGRVLHLNIRYNWPISSSLYKGEVDCGDNVSGGDSVF